MPAPQPASSSTVLAVDARWLTRDRTGVGVWLAEIVTRWVAWGRPVRLLVERGSVPQVAGEAIALRRPFHLRAARLAGHAGWRYLSPDSLIVPVLLGARAAVAVHDVAPVLHPQAHHRRARIAYRLLLDAALRRCAAIVVPSAAVQADVVAGRDPAAERVHVVAEAARRLPAPAPLPAGVSSPYLLFVGTLEPRKHPVELAEAFLAVAPPGWRLVLAGARGWLDARAVARLDACATGPAVIELGRVDDAVLAGLLAHADAFAYPSAYEGFGLPVLEAMAAGLPVLTTTAPALAETAGDAALLLDLDRPDPYGEGLRAALQRLLSDATLRQRLADAGRERAAGFDWDSTAQAVWTAVTG